MVQLSSIFNVSCASSVLMALYIGSAGLSLFRLMFPLAQMDLSEYPPQQLVHPLWKTSGDSKTIHGDSNSHKNHEAMWLRVYLSTKDQFDASFLETEFASATNNNDDDNDTDSTNNDATTTASTSPQKQLLPNDSALLWEEQVTSSSFSKSFLLTSAQCDAKTTTTTPPCNYHQQQSYQFATQWLDAADQLAMERGEGGVLAAMKAAGQGVESTSVLLNLYQSLTHQVSQILHFLQTGSFPSSDNNNNKDQKDYAGILQRQIITLPPDSEIWSAIQSNSTLRVHVLLLRQEDTKNNNDPAASWPPTSVSHAMQTLRKLASSHSLLTGGVNMVKYDLPHHIHAPRRILFQDLVYWYNKLVHNTRAMPPWVMEISKPEETQQYKAAMAMKANQQSYPYWKPQVSIKFVNEVQSYPYELAGASGMPVVRVKPSVHHPSGLAFTPAIHVDEIGLTLDKYIALNETVTSLPLRISFDRSDEDDDANNSNAVSHENTPHSSKVSAPTTTATAGGMSPARWRLLSHLSQALEKQQELGFEQSDIDEVRTLIADTNVTLLLITLLASALHLLFEFLTFKNEVTFWNNNQDLTGLSVRALFMDFFGQVVILFFLIEKESSLLITVPAAIGCVIAFWKCRKAAGLAFVKASPEDVHSVAWYNVVPRFLLGYELRATRLELRNAALQDRNEAKDGNNMKNRDPGVDLTALTIESDRLATRTIGVALLPVVVFYTCYSLVFEEHKGWLSWLITSASSGVYAFGFVMMTPQLFLNWKLKSVAHLPWRVLCYKFLNTFIDDLFSFIVRMPTMARLSCFRDDVVFFIYLYQRWLYPVDTSRPAEGFSESPEGESEGAKKDQGEALETKKNQ